MRLENKIAFRRYGFNCGCRRLTNKKNRAAANLTPDSGHPGSICYISLVIQISNTPAAVDTATLRRELEACIESEVRFDAVSRTLYSTDASVYQIHPTGVVVPGPIFHIRPAMHALFGVTI